MKTLIIALALLCPAISQAAQQICSQQRPGVYTCAPEVAGSSPNGGCVWSDNAGSCMFANVTAKPIACDIRIQVTTEKGRQTTGKKRVVIEPQSAYHSRQFSSPDKVEDARIVARCK